MLDAKTVKGLAQRLTRAEWIAAAGLVMPVEDFPGYADVVSADGRHRYLVCLVEGAESCNCPDFTERQGPAGLPCKHLLAAQLALPPVEAEVVAEAA